MTCCVCVTLHAVFVTAVFVFVLHAVFMICCICVCVTCSVCYMLYLCLCYMQCLLHVVFVFVLHAVFVTCWHVNGTLMICSLLKPLGSYMSIMHLKLRHLWWVCVCTQGHDGQYLAWIYLYDDGALPGWGVHIPPESCSTSQRSVRSLNCILAALHCTC